MPSQNKSLPDIRQLQTDDSSETTEEEDEEDAALAIAHYEEMLTQREHDVLEFLGHVQIQADYDDTDDSSSPKNGISQTIVKTEHVEVVQTQTSQSTYIKAKKETTTKIHKQ